MPFCTNCGSAVGGANPYCANCGARQPDPARTGFAPTPDPTDFLAGISNRTASVLCYVPVFGVIAAIVFLASQRFRHISRVRFDGFQSVYLFVAWLIVSNAIPTLMLSGYHHAWFEASLLGLVKMLIIVCWIYLLIKAAQEQQVHLPIIGDLAARSATEQL